MKRKLAIITFGRFNPPTKGHDVVVDTIIETGKEYSSKEAGFSQVSLFLFSSHTQNKDNPLPYDYKENVLFKLYGSKVRVRHNRPVRTIFEAASYLYQTGFNELIVVTGSDRVLEFQELLNKYNDIEEKRDPEKSKNYLCTRIS
jgi:nicotinic acid mononucleotide adenylyltransferase